MKLKYLAAAAAIPAMTFGAFTKTTAEPETVLVDSVIRRHFSVTNLVIVLDSLESAGRFLEFIQSDDSAGAAAFCSEGHGVTLTKGYPVTVISEGDVFIELEVGDGLRVFSLTVPFYRNVKPTGEIKL